jgi:hypothetical protein
LYSSETCPLRKLKGSIWRRMDKLKHSNKVTNKEVFELIGKKRTLLNNILGRKTNWTVHIL